METIKPFSVQKGFLKIMMIFSLLIFVFGMIFLIRSLIFGFKPGIIGGDWIYILLSLQGILFYVFAFTQLRYERYFIEWDEKELRYSLPKNSSEENIEISKITFVEIYPYKILIRTNDLEATLNLGNINYKALKRIKEKFQEIKFSIAKKDGYC